MKKKIAIICALPPDRNTGMATVDLSAHCVIPPLQPDAEITFYTYGILGENSYLPAEMPFNYKDIREHKEEFLNSDCFIYWGDFIHSHSYWEKDRGSWNHKMTESELRQQKEDCAQYVFLASLEEEQLKKVVIFGSTIITNTADDECDDFYSRYSARMFEHAGGVYFRDALSAAKVNPLRRYETSLACDCVFLLSNNDLNNLPDFQMAAERKHIGVFFGRSSSKLHMFLFAKSVAKRLNERTLWLSWFPSRPLLRLIAKLFGYDVKESAPSPGELLSAMSGCRFIITDTYHLSINAWRMGIPAICIGMGSEVADNSLSDKKKEILYEMYGARKFYIFVEALHHFKHFHASVQQAADALLDTQLVTKVGAIIKSHRKTAYNLLKNAIEKILAF